MERFKKWIDVALALTGLALGLVLRQMFAQIWELLRLPLWVDWPIQAPDLLAVVGAVVFFVLIRGNRKVMGFLEEVALELTKVTWPKGKETVASTGVIIVMVGFVSVVLFLFDTLWGTLTNSFLAL